MSATLSPTSAPATPTAPAYAGPVLIRCTTNSVFYIAAMPPPCLPDTYGWTQDHTLAHVFPNKASALAYLTKAAPGYGKPDGIPADLITFPPPLPAIPPKPTKPRAEQPATLSPT